MNDYATAIRNSNERKERLAKALKIAPSKRDYKPENEWSHIENHLREHNLSLVEIIRSVAKKLHGVDIPPYNPEG